MRLLKLLRVTLYLVPIIVIGFPVFTHALDLHVVINGTAVTCTNGSLTCDISGTYGNVQVTGYDPNNPADTTVKPRVIAVDDANVPLLKLITAKFKAKAAAVNGSVTFWTTPAAGNNNVLMQRVAEGWLGRVEGGQAPYTSPTNRGRFIVDGVVINNFLNPHAESIDGLYNPQRGDTSGSSKVVSGLAWPLGAINVTTFTKTEPMTLQGSRDLKGEFTFYLPLTNDFLRLNQVRVETQNPGVGDVDLASVGYTDIWDGDTARCKHKKLCPGPACPKAKGSHHKIP